MISIMIYRYCLLSGVIWSVKLEGQNLKKGSLFLVNFFETCQKRANYIFDRGIAPKRPAVITPLYLLSLPTP